MIFFIMILLGVVLLFVNYPTRKHATAIVCGAIGALIVLIFTSTIASLIIPIISPVLEFLFETGLYFAVTFGVLVFCLMYIAYIRIKETKSLNFDTIAFKSDPESGYISAVISYVTWWTFVFYGLLFAIYSLHTPVEIGNLEQFALGFLICLLITKIWKPIDYLRKVKNNEDIYEEEKLKNDLTTPVIPSSLESNIDTINFIDEESSYLNK